MKRNAGQTLPWACHRHPTEKRVFKPVDLKTHKEVNRSAQSLNGQGGRKDQSGNINKF